MTSGPDPISDLIKKLVSTYKVADEQIKQCERYTLASPSAAVNQMRYAGSHLLKFIKGGTENANDDIKRENIEKATNHCKRAAFDALENLIFAQLEFISDFQVLCRSKRDVETVYPDYVSDFMALAALQERLQAFRMVQSLSEEERKELVDISEQVSKLKRKILRLKIVFYGYCSWHFHRHCRCDARGLGHVAKYMVGSNWRCCHSAVGICVFMQEVLWMVGEKVADRKATPLAVR